MSSPERPAAGIVVLPSPYPFAETVSRLLRAIEAHGIKLFAVIDQTAEAVAVGMSLSPTTLILFGNPKAGTPVMQERPWSAIDLPLKALIVESVPGQVCVCLNAAAYIADRHGLSPNLLPNLAAAERLVAMALAG